MLVHDARQLSPETRNESFELIRLMLDLKSPIDKPWTLHGVSFGDGVMPFQGCLAKHVV